MAHCWLCMAMLATCTFVTSCWGSLDTIIHYFYAHVGATFLNYTNQKFTEKVSYCEVGSVIWYGAFPKKILDLKDQKKPYLREVFVFCRIGCKYYVSYVLLEYIFM